VAWPEFQALLVAVNYTSEELLIESGNTIVQHINRTYIVHQESVKARLHSARSLIHFSVDLWSSPHRKAFVGIHTQWVDENYTLRKALLGLPNIRHSHAGEAMASHVMLTIRTFDIQSRIGYWTSDNGSSNDTCLRKISGALDAEAMCQVIALLGGWKAEVRC